MRSFLFVLLLAASSASADVIGPDQEACQRRRAGDACRIDGRGGTCSDSTCSRIDYSGGNGPRGTVQFSCLVCKADRPALRDVPSRSADLNPPSAPGEKGTTSCAVTGAVAVGLLAVGVLAAGVVFAYVWHRRSNVRDSRA
jgi:hypothetical protein